MKTVEKMNKTRINKPKVINAIKIESKNLQEKTEEELIVLIEKTKNRLKLEKLEQIIPIWFALVQEISKRTIGLKHFETQLLAGLHLHEGQIVEMKTGEGKTLASTLPVSLNALLKKGVHVVTVNDYLAERDKNLMGKIYSGLGLSVGLVKNSSQTFEKKRNYDADITYITNSELVFDFLRDSSAKSVKELVQRPLNFCIIDEIDSILIDEARTPLIISEDSGYNNLKKLSIAKIIANILKKDIDFEIDEKRKDINLTEKGYESALELLGKQTLYDTKDPWILEILNALKANHIFKKNKDYIVLNNKIVIVDEFTGRVMEDRRWNMGIHEAMEMKENVQIGGGTKAKISITYQNFFTLYPKLSGMTGTAKTTEKEFKDIYNLNVVVIPTSKPMIRKDLSDLVYQNELAKWKAVVEQSKNCFKMGQPLLIGTSTVEKLTEIILEKKENDDSFELQELISNLMQEYQNSKLELKSDIENLPYSLENSKNSLNQIYTYLYKKILKKWEENNLFVKKIGGLFVLGTERHETRRIDNQLRGRSGRQGDPGNSQFFISLDDDLIKIFGGDSIKKWVNYLLEDKDSPLQSNILTKSLENAQKKVEAYNYEIRKNVFQYDDVLNIQRKKIFNARSEILRNQISSDLFVRLFENISRMLVTRHYKNNSSIFKKIYERKFDAYSVYIRENTKIQNTFLKEVWISRDLKASKSNFYQLGLLQDFQKSLLLESIDFYWTDHLERMSYIKDTINWRAYGQQNPLMEYNLEAFDSFKLMLEQIESYILINS